MVMGNKYNKKGQLEKYVNFYMDLLKKKTN